MKNRTRDSPNQMDDNFSPIRKVTIDELKEVIKTDIKMNKVPVYDKINGNIIQELPELAIIIIENIFSVPFELKYLPLPCNVGNSFCSGLDCV